MSEGIKNNVRAIMAWYRKLINVNFVEVDETPATVGMIRFMHSNGPAYAYAYIPWSVEIIDVSGDVHLNPAYDHANDTNGFQNPPGEHGYLTLIHEIGHTLGMKHPHDSAPNLPAAEDNYANTVMSYKFYGESPGTPMAYDLLALQYLYGVRPNHESDDTYVMARSTVDQYLLEGLLYLDPSYATKQTIWDSGGYNVLDFSEVPMNSSGYRLDINPFGWLSSWNDYQNTYMISGTAIGPAVSIQKVISSPNDDTIYANPDANVFAGYSAGRVSGHDVIYHADASDTIDLSGYTSGQVTQTQIENDLVLGLGFNGSITLKGYFQTSSRPTISFNPMPGNQPPVAIANAAPPSGTAPLSVAFSGSGSYDPDGTIASFSWAFGDGATSTAANPAHTYTTAGTYAATLAVVDNAGATGAQTLTISVTSPVETVSAPTALSGSASGTPGVSYTYTTGGSASNLAHAVQYFFDWGDGTNSGWLSPGTTSASKAWISNGTFQVKTQARCSIHTSFVSPWSSPLAVTILCPSTGTPSGPSPAIGTTGVSTSPTLSWAASSNAESYDVYFGTSPNPSLAGNTAGTSYARSGLSYSTKYYWKVVAKNSCGNSSSGPVWSFTTGSAPCTAPTTPSNPTPSHAAAGLSTNLTLKWASTGTSYDVYFGTSYPPPYAATTTSNGYDVSSLMVNRLYYWKVVAKNNCGSAEGPVWLFKTACATVGTPSDPSPSLEATGVSVNPTLKWTASYSDSYDIYFGTSPNPPFVISTSSSSFSPPTLNYGTTYYWRIIAKNSCFSATMGNVWRFTTGSAPCPAPGAPSTPWPSTGASGVSANPTLIWPASTNANSYDVYFGTSPNPSLVGNTAGTSYPRPGLSYSTTYYWKVVAKNSCGNSTPGPVWSFTTQAAPCSAPGTPSSPSPSTAAAAVSTSPTLSWSASNATSFDVYFGTSPAPGLVAATGSASYSAPNLNYNTTYYWKIVAKNGCAATAGPIWSFTTGAAPCTAPTTPSNPSPSPAAAGLGANLTLRWFSSGTSYDVYFGMSYPLPKVATTTSTSYEVSNLNSNQYYYWKIVAKSSCGSAEGPVWFFRTACATVGAPSDPSPSSMAAGVSVNPTLTWTAAYSDSYDVYFGTSPNPPYVASTGNASYTPPTLKHNTAYYWRIIAKNSCYSFSLGTVWRFTTIANAK